GAWRRKAGQGYLALKDEEMAPDERNYLALVEYRNAVQDLHGDPSLPMVGKEYASVLRDNFAEGAEGLTHEGLFAAEFFRALGDHRTPAKYFFDTAEAMGEQASTPSDRGLRERDGPGRGPVEPARTRVRHGPFSRAIGAGRVAAAERGRRRRVPPTRSA